MKVLTYNIMSGGFNSYCSSSTLPERLDILKVAIQDIDADFVALIDTFRWKEVFTENDLINYFGYKYTFCIDMNDSRVDEKIGITILSKFQIQSESIRIYNRDCVKTQININSKNIILYTVYLDDLSEDVRLKEVEDLLSGIQKDNTIIMGDFNTFAKYDSDFMPNDIKALFQDNPDLYKIIHNSIEEARRGEVIELLEQNELINAMPNFVPNVPTKLSPLRLDSPIFRVDYVYHTKDIVIDKVEVLKSDLLDKTSDHLPIYFEV